MTTQTEALKLALDRIGNYIERRKSARGIDIESIHAFDLSVDGGFELRLSDLELIKEALAQPEQEPVAWIYEDELPESYPYDAMFEKSRVIDGVRMFQQIKNLKHEPVLIVEREPAYISQGHYYEGTKPHIDPTKVWKLAIGTKLYTTPPQRKEPEQEPVPDLYVKDINGNFHSYKEKGHTVSSQCVPPSHVGVGEDDFTPQRKPLLVGKESADFAKWFNAVWIGDGEQGETIPTSGKEYDEYLSQYTLAFGAWMAAKEAAHGIKE